VLTYDQILDHVRRVNVMLELRDAELGGATRRVRD